MFRIAVVMNDNEVSHSDFANILTVLEKPMTLGDKKKEYYRFFAFNRYNLPRLFKEDDDLYLMSYDSLIIATNATDDKELHENLTSQKDLIGRFIEDGKGIFISSQKKLSNKTSNTSKSIDFLPEKYDYCLYDRPERSSAEGLVTVIGDDDVLLNYPSKIDNALIQYHCTENQFMTHWYRSHIIPQDISQYLTLLADDTSTEIPDILVNSAEKHRRVLLRTGSFTERVVVSSMALDWASHDELIENILIYITEGISHLAFIKKKSVSDVIDSYIIRAKAAKMSIREYINPTMERLGTLPHSIFIFAPDYDMQTIENFWNDCKNSSKKVLIYKLEKMQNGFELHHFTTETSIDRISLEVSNWLSRTFLPTLWGNSIWTYNYTLLMMLELKMDFTPYLDYIYEDLAKHFCNNDGNRTGSYDRVVNATCMMLEILYFAFLPSVASMSTEFCIKHPVSDVYCETVEWLVSKITSGMPRTNHDFIYILYALFRVDYINNTDAEIQETIYNKAKEVVNNYKNAHYTHASNIILCKIMFVILMLYKQNQMPHSAAVEQTEGIVQIILDKQGVNGEWRNISDTAETALMLLKLKSINTTLFGNLQDNVSNCIINAMEYLYINYNRKGYNWGSDFGTTSKAMHAIGLFDKINNFSANDFFLDVSLKSRHYLNSINIENSIFSMHKALKDIQEREVKIRALLGKNLQLTAMLAKTREWNRFFRISFFTVFTISLIFLSFLILVGLGLTSHPEVLIELFESWRSEFIFGFIGVVIGLIFMGIYSFVKGKVFGSKNGGDD